jgi:hypothetical protein
MRQPGLALYDADASTHNSDNTTLPEVGSVPAIALVATMLAQAMRMMGRISDSHDDIAADRISVDFGPLRS